MRKVYRHIFENGDESVSDNPNTIIKVDKQEPVKIEEDSINEEYFDVIGIDAVAMRDEQRKVEKDKKERVLQGRKNKTKL